MIDKQEFYHGAAILRLLDDQRLTSLRKADGGYVVNGNVYLFVKYTTKQRSPWRYTISDAEVHRLDELLGRYAWMVVIFVNGGDGICAVSVKEMSDILGDQAGWVSVRRGFNEQYAVAGSIRELDRKIPHCRWPQIVFEGSTVRAERTTNHVGGTTKSHQD
jgi:hypothetical protein